MSKKKKHKRSRSRVELFGGRGRRYTITNSTTTNEEPTIEEVEEGDSTETTNREELLKELDILNLSSNTIVIVILATLLNYYYVHSLKAKVLDELFNTNFEEDFVDTTNFPKIVNTLFLYTTGVFLTLNYTLLQESKCEHINDLNNKEVMASWKSFLASLFTFLAVIISRDNLEL